MERIVERGWPIIVTEVVSLDPYPVHAPLLWLLHLTP